MSPSNLNVKHIKNAHIGFDETATKPFSFSFKTKLFFPSVLRLLALFVLCLPIEAVFGQANGNPSMGGGVSTLSAESMLVNIATQVPSFMRLVTAIAYVMGMYFIIAGIMKLKHAGESRTYMSQEHSLKGPLVFIAVGAALLYLPTSVQIGLSTFWTEPNPYGYLKQQDQWAQFINTCYIIIQLIGVVSFIRGLVILSHVSGHGGQPGTFGRGVTHVIAGIFCINIYQFVQVVLNTLGIQYQS